MEYQVQPPAGYDLSGVVAMGVIVTLYLLPPTLTAVTVGLLRERVGEGGREAAQVVGGLALGSYRLAAGR